MGNIFISTSESLWISQGRVSEGAFRVLRVLETIRSWLIIALSNSIPRDKVDHRWQVRAVACVVYTYFLWGLHYLESLYHTIDSIQLI